MMLLLMMLLKNLKVTTIDTPGLLNKRKNGCLVEIPEIGTMAMIPQDRLTSDLKNAKPGDRIAVLIYEVDPVMGKIFANPVDVQ